MASKARRIPNNAGSANSFLNSVVMPSKAANLEAKAIALPSKKDEQKLVEAILKAIHQYVDDSAVYQKKLDSKSIDVTLGRIASLIDSYKEDFASQESLDKAKEEVLDAIDGLNVVSLLKTFVVSQISELFDTDAKKEDIEELKQWIAEQNGLIKQTVVEKTSEENKNEEQQEPTANEKQEDKSDLTLGEKEVESLKDEKEGEYKDSTVAKNFMTMQKFVTLQMSKLSTNVKKFGFTSKIFNNIKGIFKNISGKLGKMMTSSYQKISNSFKALKGGIGKLSKGFASKIGTIGKGIGKLGKGIGGAIASPFKKIGGFFSKIKNPASGIKDKAMALKEKLKEKALNFLTKTVDMIWKLISPFVKMAIKWMMMVVATVVMPIAIIIAKVLMIAAAIVLLAIGLYLAYKVVKRKISDFIKKIKGWIQYFKSGKWWDDLKAKLIAAWEWMKDFGGWLWKKFVAFGKWYLKIWLRGLKFIFVDIPVWIWEKLVQFGQWLYDNYIYKYIVEPFKKYIWDPVKKFWNEKVWPVIQPFVQSLTELKDKIVKAFSAWDTNKSIWENLKNIAGIIKDAIMEWWETSPFKAAYDKFIKPVVESVSNLITRIKKIWANFKWDENKSFIDNLRDITGIIKDAVMKWWTDDKNPIRKFYNEHIKPIIDTLSDFAKNVKDAVISWWESTSLYQEIQKIKTMGFWEWFKEKCGQFIQSIDMVLNWIKEIYEKTVGKIKQAITGVDESKLAKNQHTANWGKIPDNIKNANSAADIDKEMAMLEGRMKYLTRPGTVRNEEAIGMVQKNMDILKAKKQQLAAQQVQQMAQPINDMEKMKQQENQDLKQTGQEINEGIAQKEEEQKQTDAYMMNSMQEGNENTSKKLDNILDIIKDPTVMAFPVPVAQRNNPTMANTMRRRR